MRFTICLLFIPALLFLAGCDEYSSPVPAGTLKESVIDTLYPGKWDYAGMEQDSDSTMIRLEPHSLVILPFDDHRYAIQMMKKDSGNRTPELYEATTCRIANQKIVSVRLISPKEGKTEYLIYMYGLQNDTLWYKGFQRSKLEKQFEKTSALKKYLTTYINDTSVHLPTRYYVRVPYQ